MPLSCILGKDVIYSESFSIAEWEDLKLKIIRGTLNLTLPCCNAKANLRSRSYKRRQHFAHLPGQRCKSDTWSDYSGKRLGRKGRRSESFDHIRVKEIIEDVALGLGWHAIKEYSGHTPSGQVWRSDILLEKGERKIVFEIQISSQKFADYRVRQQKYRESGFKCIWFSNSKPEFSDEEIPIFELSKQKGVFVVDFPEFFIPERLKLSSDYTGVAIGEFVQRILELGIPWEQDWVTKHDYLARMEEEQRLSKPFREMDIEHASDQLTETSCYTSIKNSTKAIAPKENSIPETGTHHKGFALMPHKYLEKAHRYAVWILNEHGMLITGLSWRGNVDECKAVIARELPNFPIGTYAEVRLTMNSDVVVYKQLPNHC